MSTKQLSRRDFLRRSAAAAAGAGVAMSGIGAGRGLAAEKAALKQRVLGRTELKVTEISFGGTRLDDRAVLNHAIDRGINLIHVSPGYNKGKAFPEYCAVTRERRDQVVFALSQSPNEQMLDDALAQLGTKYVDILMGSAQSVENIASDQLKDGLLAMKNKGKAKWVGFACHKNQPDVLSKAVELGWPDVVMVAYNPGNRAQLDPVIERARDSGMGIVAMKAVKDVPSDEHETAAKSVLNNPKVSTLVRGFNTKEMVDQYVEWALTRTANLTPEDERRVAAKMAGVACTMCGNCGICPRNVAVTDIFRYEYYAQDGQLDVARDEYARLAACERATNCDDCGLCEQVCSNDLPIRRRLQEVHTLLA